MRSSRVIAQSALRVCVAGIILVGLAAWPAFALAITGIDVANKADRVIIAIQGDCTLSLTPLTSPAGRYIGFQLPCKLVARGRLVGVHSGGICNVRYSNFRSNPPITRIVVNSSRHLDYSTEWSPDRRRVEISVMKSGQAVGKSARQQVGKPASQQVSESASQPISAPEVTVAPVGPDPAGDAPAALPRSAAEAARAQVTPEETAARVAAYRAIAEKSRQARVAAKAVPDEKPAGQLVSKSASQQVSAPQVTVAPAAPLLSVVEPTKRTVNASAYRAIAERSRRPAVVRAETRVAVAAGPGASEVKSPEPQVRVLGMTETTPKIATSAAAVEPADTTWEQAGVPKVAVEATSAKSSPSRVALTVPVRAKSDDMRKVSLNFLGADINDVLKAIAVQSGHNVVASKDVTGNVTLSLSNVTVDEALDYVAKLSGYAYTNDDGTYLVSQANGIRNMAANSGAGFVVETIKLSYAKADDVMAIAKARFPEVQIDKVGVETAAKAGSQSKTGSQAGGPKNNLLVLTGASDQVKNAVELVGKFEEAFRVQAVESKRTTYRVKYANPPELADAIMALVPGVDVAFAPSSDFTLVKFKSVKSNADGAVKVERKFDNTGVSESAGAPGQGNKAEAAKSAEDGSDPGKQMTGQTNSRTLIIVGPDEAVKRALDTAAQLDVKAPQIKIDAKITSINESGEKKLGVTWEWGDLISLEAFTDFEKITDTVTSPTSPSPINGSNVRVPHNKMIRQPWSFSAALSALIANGDAQLLASPSIVCLERNPGVFFVGDEVTYIQRIEQTATGQNIVTDTKRVGVQLLAVGEVNTDGYVTLYLRPEVSTLKLSIEQGVTLPIVSSRFTDHVVRVKSGETIVIGGLIRNDEINELRKVPFLGNLPVLGHLFRHKGKTTEHTEVVMFITATILQD